MPLSSANGSASFRGSWRGSGCSSSRPFARCCSRSRTQTLAARVLTVRKGQKLDPQETADWLARAGYLRVPTVSVHGEFAARGEVIDIYAPGEPQAFRITLEFDQVSSIRSFDPLNQASTATLDGVRLIPCREVLFEEDELAALRSGAARARLRAGGDR